MNASVLFARIDKMDKTDSVVEFRKDFDEICKKIDVIKFKVILNTMRWNLKNIILV